MKTKLCSVCDQPKFLVEFHSDKSSEDGHVGICKSCKSKIDKQRRLNDPDSARKSRENSRRFHENNPEYAKTWSRAWREANPEKKAAVNKRYTERHPERVKAQKKKYQKRMVREIRNSKYVRQYGITLTEYEARLKSQNGVCAICGGTDKTNLAIDHCHATGNVRGLLCHQCNRALGGFKDDPSILANAIKYLTKE